MQRLEVVPASSAIMYFAIEKSSLYDDEFMQGLLGELWRNQPQPGSGFGGLHQILLTLLIIPERKGFVIRQKSDTVKKYNYFLKLK